MFNFLNIFDVPWPYSSTPSSFVRDHSFSFISSIFSNGNTSIADEIAKGAKNMTPTSFTIVIIAMVTVVAALAIGVFFGVKSIKKNRDK